MAPGARTFAKVAATRHESKKSGYFLRESCHESCMRGKLAICTCTLSTQLELSLRSTDWSSKYGELAAKTVPKPWYFY